MKKIILGITLTVTMGLLPLLSSANPFTQLIQNAVSITPICNRNDASFCDCYGQTSKQYCITKLHLQPPQCTPNLILPRIKTIGAAAACDKYKPDGVDPTTCIDDTTYFMDHCSCTTTTCTPN